MSKLTGWFGDRPVRKGVYESLPFDGIEARFFRYWNGDRFGGFSRTVQDANTIDMRSVNSMRQDRPWRGLAKEPK